MLKFFYTMYMLLDKVTVNFRLKFKNFKSYHHQSVQNTVKIDRTSISET